MMDLLKNVFSDVFYMKLLKLNNKVWEIQI